MHAQANPASPALLRQVQSSCSEARARFSAILDGALRPTLQDASQQLRFEYTDEAAAPGLRRSSHPGSESASLAGKSPAHSPSFREGRVASVQRVNAGEHPGGGFYSSGLRRGVSQLVAGHAPTCGWLNHHL